MAKLHCLYAVRDDLHDFAERFVSTVTFAQLNAPCGLLKDFGDFQCGILHREGAFQVEMMVVRPGVVIPPHTHPGTDSIEYPVTGGVRLYVGDKDPFTKLDDERFLSFIKGKGIRIAGDAVHGGQAHPTMGAVFLSIQRWSIDQAHIAQNYDGAGVSPAHDDIIDRYRLG